MESIFDLFILDNMDNCLSSVSHNSFMAQLVEWLTSILMVWGSNSMTAHCFCSFFHVFLCFGPNQIQRITNCAFLLIFAK